MRIILIIPVLLLAYCTSVAQGLSQNSGSPYGDEILKQRRETNTEMKTDAKSPIPEENRKDFTGLNFFAPDSTYKVVAKFERFDNPFRFKMKTTTDRLPEYSLFGKVTFVLNGNEFSLNVYQNIDLLKKPGYENYLFIPFNDLTNGIETYAGGRFMDGEDAGNDSLVIDFNKAYNPYCAYNHKYSCPIPPVENTLPIRIEAGEKKWHE